MKYAKKKGTSKGKRKGQPNQGHPVALWHKCNTGGPFAGRGEFVNYAQTRAQAARGEIPRGHVKLPQCECAKALGPRPKSLDEQLREQAAKLTQALADKHEATGTVCGKCYTLISVSGNHYC